MSTNKRKRQQPRSRASSRLAKLSENVGKEGTSNEDVDTNKHPRLDSTTNKKVSLMLLYK